MQKRKQKRQTAELVIMNYTDEELMQAWENGPSITDTATMLSRFRAFLFALPNKQNDVQEERDELNKDLSALLRVLDAHDVTEGVEKVREMMRRLQVAEHINEGYIALEQKLEQALSNADITIAIRRMKEVSDESLWAAYNGYSGALSSLDGVREVFINAVKGEKKPNNMLKSPEYYIKGNPQVIEKLEEIANDECGVETLKTRFSDSLDFHDIGVANLLCALHAAYYAGYNKRS